MKLEDVIPLVRTKGGQGRLNIGSISERFVFSRPAEEPPGMQCWCLASITIAPYEFFGDQWEYVPPEPTYVTGSVALAALEQGKWVGHKHCGNDRYLFKKGQKLYWRAEVGWVKPTTGDLFINCLGEPLFYIIEPEAGQQVSEHE